MGPTHPAPFPQTLRKHRINRLHFLAALGPRQPDIALPQLRLLPPHPGLWCGSWVIAIPHHSGALKSSATQVTLQSDVWRDVERCWQCRSDGGLFHSIYRMLFCTHTHWCHWSLHTYGFISSGFSGSSVTTTKREEFPWQLLVHLDWTLSSHNLLHIWTQTSGIADIWIFPFIESLLILCNSVIAKDTFSVISSQQFFSSTDNYSFCAFFLTSPFTLIEG